MNKGNIINLHRQMARDALREAARRKAGRKPIGLSDKAIDYLTRANPLAFIRRTARVMKENFLGDEKSS